MEGKSELAIVSKYTLLICDPRNRRSQSTITYYGSVCRSLNTAQSNLARQSMYVYNNIEARSCNHCCSGKTVSTTLWTCVCSLSYPACNAHAPYCHLWPDPFLQYFFALSHKRYNFRGRKKITEHKMFILIPSATFVWNISHSKKKWARYDKKCILVFM